MASINPNRLKEARVIRGLTIDALASMLLVSKQAVSKYENGKTNPSPETIMKISDILEVPISFLTKGDENLANHLNKSPFFFRTLKTTKKYEKEYAHIKLKWAYELDDALRKLAGKDLLPNIPDLSNIKGIEQKSIALRQYWGLGLEPVDNMVDLLENNSIPVFCINTNQVKIDAYSQYLDERPIVVLNSSRGTAVRWRFDIAHELGHLILHKNISKSELDDPIKYEQIEKEANIFASAFLLPKDSFGVSIASDKLTYFLKLKKKWKVSVAAMIYRAKSLEIISEEKAERLSKQISIKGWRKEEPGDSEISYERPSVVKNIIDGIVTDKVIASSLIEKIRMSTNDIEEIGSLGKGFFSKFGINGTDKLNSYVEEDTYIQLSFLNWGGEYNAE